MKRRSPFWLLIVGVGSLALSGCASLMESGASLLGREPVPARVAGLPLGDLATLGIDDGVCAELAEARRQDRRVSGRWLREDALPACARRIEAAREARRYDQELDRLVERAWQAEQAAERERARQRAEQRRVREAMEAARRDAEARQEANRKEDNRSRLRERLADAHILSILENVPDQPLAFSLGQPSERTLKNFLACLEVGYPNQGYQVDRQGDDLTVTALQADMLRGDVDIRAHFVNVWDTWMLESLRVAEMTADTPRDRFMLAQNLMAGPCYGIDELLWRGNDDGDHRG